ncbi:hypothetical protein NMY22_g15467 [Coprinellus aureogranulatus]|nr:hypothetical protein NMY22_g15467 [Coprinellus aureogranulatus]
MSFFGALMPTCWWNLNPSWTWDLRKSAYFDRAHDIITIIPLISGGPVYHIGSPEVAAQLIGTEKALKKDHESSVGVSNWGSNIFVVSGETWKRHRRVMTPAFGRKTYEAVLKETLSVYREMLEDEGRSSKDSFTMDCKVVTNRLGFLLISRCGFGLQLPWKYSNSASKAGGQTDSQVIEAALMKEFRLPSIIARAVLPPWAYKLPIPILQELGRRDALLRGFGKKAFAERIRELDESRDVNDSGDLGALAERHDVLSRLVIANQGLDKLSLTEDEVLGNTFFLMFAGNETTAMVIAETLTLLAINSEEQELAYQEVISVLGKHDEPTLDQLDHLKHLHMCFLEGARLYPPGTLITRELTEDAIVEVQHPAPARLVLKKGTKVAMDEVNMLRDPYVFDRPHEFVPSRWKTISEHKVPVFGYSARACIGRKFAQTEALSFLSCVLRDWRVDPVLENGETKEAYMERVMGAAAQDGLTFGVKGQLNLRFTRRK